MEEEIKKNWNDALFQFEKVIQSMVISEQQQEILTASLASFGEAMDNILSWINILDRYASRIDNIGSDDKQIETWIERLESLNGRVDAIEKRIDNLGKTDAHTGEQTIEERLNIIEGMQDIMCSAHKGHTNYSEAEYFGMHESIGKSREQLEGMQKKLDRISKLLENAKFEISGKDALKL